MCSSAFASPVLPPPQLLVSSAHGLPTRVARCLRPYTSSRRARHGPTLRQYSTRCRAVHHVGAGHGARKPQSLTLKPKTQTLINPRRAVLVLSQKRTTMMMMHGVGSKGPTPWQYWTCRRERVDGYG
eukprot:156029-Rhodomonas_salina.1